MNKIQEVTASLATAKEASVDAAIAAVLIFRTKRRAKNDTGGFFSVKKIGLMSLAKRHGTSHQ